MDAVGVANMALLQIGAQTTVSSVTVTDNTAEGNAVCALYQPMIDNIMRAANWDFARYQASLTLLRAATGTPENPDGTLYAEPPRPWLYEYAYPSDALKIRFVQPYTSASAATPFTTVDNMAPVVSDASAVRFVKATNYDVWPARPASIAAAGHALTVTGGAFVATDAGKTITVPGAGASGASLTTTIAAYVSASQVTLTAAAGTALTAVSTIISFPQSFRTVIQTPASTAEAVYTRRVSDPALWDQSFLIAASSYLGAWLINALARNRAQWNDQMKISMDIVNAARVTDGNEGMTSQEHLPDWIRARGVSGYHASNFYYESWEQIIWPNGSAF